MGSFAQLFKLLQVQNINLETQAIFLGSLDWDFHTMAIT